MRSIEPWSKRGKRDYPEFIANILNVPGNLLGLMAGIPAPMPGCPSAPQEVSEAAGREFSKTLQELVNQWISSGKQKAEEPWSRTADWRSDKYPKTITETLSEFRDRNPPIVFPNKDGQFEIAPMGPFRHSSWATMLSLSVDPQQHARDHAIAQFVLLLRSRCPQRLFRCDECRKYFVLERKPRKIIKQGSFCSKSKCRKQASAKRMDSSSNNRHSTLEGFAADALRKYKPKDGPLKEWIRDQVNQQISNMKTTRGNKSARESAYDPISLRWVTGHMGKIEAKVSKGKSVAV
jgi:hypothetical protein